MDERSQLLDLARRLAREAGAIQRERYESELQIDTKSSEVDLVTDVDRACERAIVEELRRARPADAILAEEGSGVDRPDAPWCWVIDPLDGTNNYAHGYPWFCVSIAVERAGEPEVGVVYNPLLDELFHAVRGGGAFRNGAPIRVTAETELGRCMLATGFSYDRRAHPRANLHHVEKFVRLARALRRSGSAALDLCSVASGRLDGYWEFQLSPWDVAAGALIVHEAGGRCSDIAGRVRYDGGEMVASNAHVHDAMLEVLRRG